MTKFNQLLLCTTPGVNGSFRGTVDDAWGSSVSNRRPVFVIPVSHPRSDKLICRRRLGSGTTYGRGLRNAPEIRMVCMVGKVTTAIAHTYVLTLHSYFGPVPCSPVG